MDYVGTKSKGQETPNNQQDGKRQISGNTPINPTRLLINGLIKGMTEDQLKKLFPKCTYVTIPKRSRKRGSPYGFVQFCSPTDTKAAFEAAKKFPKGGIYGNNFTVLYAKATNHPLNAQGNL